VAIETNLERSLFRSNSDQLPDNLVGAAVMLKDGNVKHAGLFIRYNGISKLFHFTGKEVLIESVNDTDLYFHKELKFINPSLTPAFLSHCEIVLKEAKPKFGYFYAGSMYDAEGKFINAGDLPEYMTCVGFCLNFIKYFLVDEDFFHYIDWDSSNLEDEEIGEGEGYIEWFLEEKVKSHYPDINIEAFKENMRRILPVEYISGGYSETLPVRKQFTDIVSSKLKTILTQRSIS
jgi:hypothetical protein